MKCMSSCFVSFCDRYFVSAISPYFCKKPDSPSAASHFTQRLSFHCSVILPRGLFCVIGTLWNNFLFHKKCGSANIFLFTEPHFTTMVYFFYLFLFCLILQIAFPDQNFIPIGGNITQGLCPFRLWLSFFLCLPADEAAFR